MPAYRLHSESERRAGTALRALFLMTLPQEALCSAYLAQGLLLTDAL